MKEQLLAMLARALTKITSGRWLLTTMVGLGWLYLVVNKGVDGKDALAVTLLVFNWYFQRQEKKDEV